MHPTVVALERASKRRKTEMSEDDRQRAAHELIQLMLQVVEEDN